MLPKNCLRCTYLVIPANAGIQVFTVFYCRTSPASSAGKSGLQTELLALERIQGAQFVGILLEYLSKRAKISDANQAFTFLKETFIGTEVETNMATLAEYLKDVGFKQGLAQGLEKGVEQGIEQEKEHLALKLLQRSVDALVVAEVTELPLEKIHSLQQKNHH